MQRHHQGQTGAGKTPASAHAAGRNARLGHDGPAAQRRLADAIHGSPRQVAQRQIMAAPGAATGRAPARGGVAQRAIWNDGKQYWGDGERSDWRALLKREVVKEYNNRTGKNLKGTANLTDEDLDRCHKVSFSDIEDVVIYYLRGDIDKNELLRLTQSLTDPRQAKEIGKWRTFLVESVESGYSADLICGQANKLLGILNSSLCNVILGNASTNRGIQDKLDLHFIETSSGGWSLTPYSRSIATEWTGFNSGVPFTPGGTNIRSSSSGNVPYGDLTPNTKTLIDKNL